MDVMIRTFPIDWTGIAPAVRSMFEGKVSAVCRSKAECADLVAFFGSDASFCPYLPILLTQPGAPSVTVVEGQGVTTVAELRDLCIVTWERTEERLRRNGGVMFDFDALREKHHLARREDADAQIREAMWRRAAQHKANARTDPGRDPMSDQNPRKSHTTTENGDAPWPLTS